MAAAAVLPSANGGMPAARLRRAELTDACALAKLYGVAEADMLAWLETGGVLLVEDGTMTALAAVRWQPTNGGWRVEQLVSLPAEQGQAYGRWLMTKLESLAIKGNVARLDVALADKDQAPYYQRLGYRAGANGDELSKRVGGVWQRQGAGP
ncbi:MAG TPA: GNAT family N-acetyltransferase [Trueperaceae bacterium]|nr:GNAT family N-acetyltransferase [Trueperaceae bacterium]